MDAGLIAILTSWSIDPLVLSGLIMGAALYLYGWRRLAATRRGRAALSPWRALAYGLGLLLVGLALLSPVETFSSIFFFMHMVQHMLLLSAAPLLLLGSPLLPILWALPRPLRRAIGLFFVPAGPAHAFFNALTHPVVAVTLSVAIIAVWHVPSFYDAAQGRNLIHDLEHGMFLGSGLLYWWPVAHPAGGKRRLSYGLGMFYIAPNMFVQNAIGMVLTFARQPLYETYQHVPRLWGISVVLDQQLAGAVMGLMGAAVNLAAITVLVVLFLRGEEGKPRSGTKRPVGPPVVRRGAG